MDSGSLSDRPRGSRPRGSRTGPVAPAIIIHPSDNVATALRLIPAESSVVLTKHGKTYRIVVREEIPMGHKFSLRKISAGETIVKYGEPIGLATAAIGVGYHVHTHNVQSQRAREDMVTKGEA